MQFLKSGLITFIILYSGLLLSQDQGTAQEVERTDKLYRSVDANGNVSYSDLPSDGAKEVTYVQNPTMHMKVPKINFQSTKVPSEVAGDYYSQIGFSDLESGAVIRNNGGVISLTAMLEPELASGHFIRFYIDSVLINGQQKSTSISVDKMQYGPHFVSFKVVTDDGSLIQQSEETQVNLLHVVRKSSSNNAVNGHGLSLSSLPSLATYQKPISSN